MSSDDDWLDLGLDELPVTLAQRVRLLRVVLASAAVLRARLDQALAPAGITSQQAGLLQFIQAQPQAPTISFVAKALDMSHQNVKQIALALERKGFLEIAVDAHDRRSRRAANQGRCRGHVLRDGRHCQECGWLLKLRDGSRYRY